MIGQIVGNYEVVGKIGEGGMGAVYKGVDLMLEREVAIKALRPELGNQPQIVERFRSEAVTLAKLNHPNIATLYSFFRQGDFFFMVMEFVRGTTMDKLVGPAGVMSCEQAVPLFCQALEGIDHAHRFGVIHRDIKPSNIMLTDAGLVKVLDFGIARVLGTSRMTRAGTLIGTIEYMSPEQVRGFETDARSDIYSLGMLLYEMLTGRVPFTSDSEFELMRAQVEQTPVPPRKFAPSIPEDVEWAIMCATEKDPSRRFQTAGAFRAAIVNSMDPHANVPKMALPLSAPSVLTVPGVSGPPSNDAVIYGSGPSDRVSKPPASNPAIYDTSSSDVQAVDPFITTPGTHGSPSHDVRTSEPSASSLATSGNSEPGVMQPTRLAPEPFVDSSRSSLDGNIKGTRLADTAPVPLPGSYKSQDDTPGTSSIGASPSFFSKLTWKHYAAAGTAAVFVLVVLIIIPVGIWLSGSSNSGKAADTPAAAGSQSIRPAGAEQPTANPSQTPAVTQGGAAPSAPTTGQNPGMPFIPPQPEETPKSGGQQRVANKPARQPQRSNDSGSSSAERDRARRRAAALKALDQ